MSHNRLKAISGIIARWDKCMMSGRIPGFRCMWYQLYYNN